MSIVVYQKQQVQNMFEKNKSLLQIQTSARLESTIKNKELGGLCGYKGIARGHEIVLYLDCGVGCINQHVIKLLRITHMQMLTVFM